MQEGRGVRASGIPASRPYPDYDGEGRRREDHLLPVRSEQPVPKELVMDCMEVIRKQTVKAPVARYDVIVPDICGCGVNIVATGNIG